jgi:hypothetical protein
VKVRSAVGQARQTSHGWSVLGAQATLEKWDAQRKLLSGTRRNDYYDYRTSNGCRAHYFEAQRSAWHTSIIVLRRLSVLLRWVLGRGRLLFVSESITGGNRLWYPTPHGASGVTWLDVVVDCFDI